jgi:hypothetical protein
VRFRQRIVSVDDRSGFWRHERTRSGSHLGPNSSVPTPASTGDTAAPATEQIPGSSNEIIVHVGVDDAATVGSRVENVALGSDVVLRLTSDTDETYHVHGYDLEQKVAAGVEAQFEFTADMAATSRSRATTPTRCTWCST